MKEYQITGKNGSRELARFLAENGQVILPIVGLIEGSRIAARDHLPTELKDQAKSVMRAIFKLSEEDRSEDAHQPGHELAERVDGAPMGRFRLPCCRERLQKDNELQGPLDSRRA